MNERYARQISLAEIGEEGQQKLLSSQVAIVGCGGLGAIAATYLAGAGVGRLILVDGDVPSLSNVHRQVLYTGRETESKAASLKKRLNALNPEVEIKISPAYLTKDNINELLTGVDLILECTDDIMCKYLVNDFAALDQIPLVYGAIYKYEGYVSTFLNTSDEDIHLRDIFPEPDDTLPTCAEVGVLNTIAGLIGLLQANEALKVILGIGEVLSNQLLTYDCLSNRQMTLKLKKNWDKDLEEHYEKTSYTSLDCSFVSEIEIDELLKNRADYKLVSVMTASEHQAIDNETLHNISLTTDFSALANSEKAIVLYCKYGRTSKQTAAKLLDAYPNKNILSLKNGYQAYQKFKASH